MLKDQEALVPINEVACEAKAKAQRLERLRREAKQMGLQLVELEKAA